MEKYTIGNDKLRVTVAEKGAELISIYDMEKQREVIWQADPAIWNRHAPILFPNVGQYAGGCLKYAGKSYKEGQHGFARDSIFELVSLEAEAVTMVLRSSEKTRERYPFDFELYVTHRLCHRTLTVNWQVKNTGAGPMYFTIGGHPGFIVPVLEGTAFEDYSLSFTEDLDSLVCIPIDTSVGCGIPDAPYVIGLKDHKLMLDRHLFDADALVLDDGQIRNIAILMPDGSPYVTMDCPEFTNFGIWTKPGAPYVCLEPWSGRCDDRDFNDDISVKKNINALNAEQIFDKSYTVTIH